MSSEQHPETSHDGASHIEGAPPAPSETAPASQGSSFAASVHAFIARIVGSPKGWAILLALFCVVPIGRTLAREVPKPPALKMPLPAFELTNQRGERVTLETFRGKVWVADFVFTSCPIVCPKLTQRMVQIQHRSRNLGDAFHLVTFTVDPENDTPERLAAYAASYHANPGRWSFLTGSLGDLETTVVKGFKLAMGKEETSPGIFSIFHGERLVLVDQDAAIRGYYEATDGGVSDLMRDIGILVNVR